MEQMQQMQQMQRKHERKISYACHTLLKTIGVSCSGLSEDNCFRVFLERWPDIKKLAAQAETPPRGWAKLCILFHIPSSKVSAGLAVIARRIRKAALGAIASQVGDATPTMPLHTIQVPVHIRGVQPKDAKPLANWLVHQPDTTLFYAAPGFKNVLVDKDNGAFLLDAADRDGEWANEAQEFYCSLKTAMTNRCAASMLGVMAGFIALRAPANLANQSMPEGTLAKFVSLAVVASACPPDTIARLAELSIDCLSTLVAICEMVQSIDSPVVHQVLEWAIQTRLGAAVERAIAQLGTGAREACKREMTRVTAAEVQELDLRRWREFLKVLNEVYLK